MNLEVVRLLEARLNDGTDGVNAYRTSVPDDDGDGNPPEVDVVTPFGSDERSKQLARRHLPQGFATTSGVIDPKLILWVPTPADFDGWVGQGLERADGIQVAMGYVTEDTESASATIDAHRLMRAAKRSCDTLIRAADAAKTKNQVEILNILDFQLNESMALLPGALVQLVGVLTLQAQDTWK